MNRSDLAGADVYRVTGPPENFITAMTIGWWAVNERNVGVWKRLNPGDLLLFHSTIKSGYSSGLDAAVVGYARVGQQKRQKNAFWWVQEVEEHKNHWPYTFDLESIQVMADLSEQIDLSKPIHEKGRSRVRAEVRSLVASGVLISSLNQRAKMISTDTPQFPVNGSMSHLDPVYPSLLFSEFARELFLCSGNPDTYIEDEFFSDKEEQELQQLSKEELLRLAQAWKPKGQKAHGRSWSRTRKEDVRQKKLVAAVEDRTCQVCGFRCEYLNNKGEVRWIIHVDHIREKATGGDESLKNLWVLCPNCHEQKTRGIIEVDVRNARVTRNGSEISIRDSHLFV